MDAVVAALAYYPVKGCAGVSVPSAEVTAAGLKHDRTFMVVDAEGAFRSQRKMARLAVIRPTLSDDTLTLSAHGVEDVVVDVRRDGKRQNVTVWQHDGDGIDQGDEVAEWLSDLLEHPSRLVRVAPEHDRQGSGATTGPINFPDSTAVTVASESSLDDLNARLLEAGGEAIEMRRFRPNIVVRGWPEPFTEDRVRRVSIGGAAFGFAKHNIRCRVTTVDPDTGVVQGPEPLRTLASYRRDRTEGGVAFAMKAAVTRSGTVSVGDRLEVGEWGPALNA